MAATTLPRARRLATLVLVALAAVYAATHLVPVGTGPWLMLVRRMAEAGMVGGLADWFAVTALFRHPLGLPIPHTALLPKNQQAAARNVGRFFATHFLDRAELEPRLTRLALSRHAADWLARPENARALAGELTTLLTAVLTAEPSKRMLVRARAWLRAEASQAGADAAIAAAIATTVKQGIRTALAGDVLLLLRNAVDTNRAGAVAIVQDRSRWWIHASVDRRVANLAVDGIISLLDDLATADSPLRRDFEEAVDRAVESLATSGALTRAVAEARTRIVRSGTVDRLALRLADTIRSRVAARIADDPAPIVAALAALIADLSGQLRADQAAAAALDARLAAGIARLVDDLRDRLGTYVADVIASWPADAMVTRFEAELGPDLQYIRINGALLGALIGGAFYALERVLG